jgi:hypothetical protein
MYVFCNAYVTARLTDRVKLQEYPLVPVPAFLPALPPAFLPVSRSER